MVQSNVMPSQSPVNPSVSRLQDYFGLASRSQVWIPAGLLCLGTFFKFWNVFLFRFNSDEPQHLHVVWAWTHGLVQYRDVFDNHMPLFHLMCAPILGLMGEHAADLYWMRLLMVPLYFLSAWCIYRIGEIAFSRRLGLWAMLMTSGISAYHLCSTEFRTDNVWMVLWFLCLITLIANRFDFRSVMVTGLLLGLGFGISMKTTLMLATILLASGIGAGLVGWRRLGVTVKQLGVCAMIFTACLLLVPLLIMGFFAAKGVWSQFQYCVFAHNLEPATTEIYLNLLWLVGGVPILIYATRKFIRKETNPTVAFRQAFVGLTCGMYFLLLKGVWRHLTREDYLPLFPLVALVCVALLSRVSDMLSEWRLMPRLLLQFPLPAFAACLVMILDLTLRIPVTNDAVKEVNWVRDVLVLTNPDDSVFDCKGETVFRKRSVRYVLETLTTDRIERGEIADELEEQSPEARARVAVVNDEITENGEKFIEANYLTVGHGVMVAGSRLNAASTADGTARFHIAIPDRYEIIAPDRPAPGLLDGTPAEGGRFLAVGEHSFVPAEPGPPLAVLWAQAVDRHFTNFFNAPELRVSYQNVPVPKTGRRTVEIIDPTKKRVGDFLGIFRH
jgi:hypothetical protein